MGTIKGSKVKNWYAEIRYTVVSQSKKDNTSTVKLELYVYAATSGSFNETANSAYYVIQGKKTYAGYNWGNSGYHKLGERTITLDHRSNGELTTEFSASWCSDNAGSYYTPYLLKVAGDVKLPTIPRESTIRAGSFTIGKARNITIERKSKSFTHKLSYSIGQHSGTIPMGNSSDTVVSWTPPNSLLPEVPDTSTKRIKITCKTYSSSTQSSSTYIGATSATFPLLVSSSVKPVINTVTFTPLNENPFLNTEKLFVADYTRALVEVEATPGTGAASMKRIEVRGLERTKTVSLDWTSELLTAGDKKVTVVAYDSREHFDTKEEQLTVLPYAEPVLMMSSDPNSQYFAVYRCSPDPAKPSPPVVGDYIYDDNGSNILVKPSATYSTLNGKNKLAFKARLRNANGFWQEYVDLKDGVPIVFTGTPNTITYEVEVVVTDLLGNSKSRVFLVPTTNVTLHLSQNGKGVAIGKYSEKDEFEVDFPTHFYKDVVLDGKLTFNNADKPVVVNSVNEIDYSTSIDAEKNVSTINTLTNEVTILVYFELVIKQGKTIKAGSVLTLGSVEQYLPKIDCPVAVYTTSTNPRRYMGIVGSVTGNINIRPSTDMPSSRYTVGIQTSYKAK